MDADRVLECFVELDALTRMPRTGWILAGVTDLESVADHCYETALFTYVLSRYLDREVDLKKALLMALFHETGEARLADLPRRSKPYVGKAKRGAEREAALDILDGVAEELIELQDELHRLATPEARLVEAAEELQIIFKAMVYAKEGRGDISEYRNDVQRYDSQGVECAERIARLIGQKLNRYLAGKDYWETGYRRRE